MFFVRVGSFEVEEQLITGSFVDKVGSVFEGFDFVEFKFHEVVDGFDVRLPGMGAGDDGMMLLAFERFDNFCVVGRAGLPGAAGVFGAVIGLTDGLIGQGVKLF